MSANEAKRPNVAEPPGAAGVLIDRQELIALAVDAARSGDTNTLTHAIAAGVSVNATSPRGDSLLMLACYYGHADAVRALIDRGADVTQLDARGQTPLAGVAFNRVDMVRWLVEQGASLDIRDATGLRAIDIARAMSATDVASILV